MARTHESQTSFSRVHHLVRHIKSHMKTDENMARLKCQHCGDDFDQSDLLHTHITKLHPPTNTTPLEIFSLDLHSMPVLIPSRRPSAVPKQTSKPLLTPQPPSTRAGPPLPAWRTTCNPNPSGLPPFDPDTSSAESMGEWLESFWPGYICSTLSADFNQAPGAGGKARRSPQGHKPNPTSRKDAAPLDAWDLAARVASAKRKQPPKATSSSSSYGSPGSAHSRASSWSGSAVGHIPGKNRDVLDLPFGYPMPL